MGVFNPKMLDASIRDVVSSLSNDRKTDVLLYALQHLPAGPRSVYLYKLPSVNLGSRRPSNGRRLIAALEPSSRTQSSRAFTFRLYTRKRSSRRGSCARNLDFQLACGALLIKVRYEAALLASAF